ncbi:AbfB domain-containing protein [Actinoplanes bogorensis]|uniref:AbfB domain-containing protein n=1 Tax=Paractinoplanes bogorensis TaxID=1610840 RepID=A0ABS5Z0A6_9ACTN|nr:AbfB domain-containing protein [Actinoplanes bogorensis]MBU2669129.1 AbfB domain-containing protein [Actinoplanes bogorensis]
MPDEERPDRLRIGGWVPPYRDTKGPLRPPVPPRNRVSAISAALLSGPIRRHAEGGLGRRAVLAAATGTLILVAGLTALALRGDNEGPTLSQRVVLPPFVPSAPVTILPSPSSSPSAAASSPGSVTRSPSHNRPTEATTTKRPTTRTPPSKPPAVQLTVGRTVGLVPVGRGDLRLRHRDFVARFDPISDGSSRLDRHDSRFTGRTGLADRDCVSLESENYPGYFLRHRNFVLRLEQRDRSSLFDQDATFCPRTVNGGTALVLESVNYPGRFWVARDGVVRLEQASPESATAVVPADAV